MVVAEWIPMKCASMLAIGLAGLGRSSPFELVLLGWIIGLGAMATVSLAVFRQEMLKRRGPQAPVF